MILHGDYYDLMRRLQSLAFVHQFPKIVPVNWQLTFVCRISLIRQWFAQVGGAFGIRRRVVVREEMGYFIEGAGAGIPSAEVEVLRDYARRRRLLPVARIGHCAKL